MSRQLFCFQHPLYDGLRAPVVTCKVCCGIFIGKIKERQAQKIAESEHKISDQLEDLKSEISKAEDSF